MQQKDIIVKYNARGRTKLHTGSRESLRTIMINVFDKGLLTMSYRFLSGYLGGTPNLELFSYGPGPDSIIT